MSAYVMRRLNPSGTGARLHRVYRLPSLSPTNYWVSVTDVPCPSCGTGTVLWHEAGFVPGYRRCDKCKRHFLASSTVAEPELVVLGRRF